jgi:two-component system, cell cycle sensor histidine kinase and response regulator CckA
MAIDKSSGLPGSDRGRVENPARLAALRDTELLDTPHEETFDRLTHLAAQTLSAPIALISLVDDKREFFKSSFGLPKTARVRAEISISQSLAKHVVATGEALVVGDGRTDPRMKGSLPISDVGLTAYLGVPLTANGLVLGSLSVVDLKPRTWTPEQISNLETLAALVIDAITYRMDVKERLRLELEVREAQALLDQRVKERTASLVERTHELQLSEERFELVARATNDAVWDWDLATNEVWWNEGITKLFGYRPEDVSSDVTFWYEHIAAADRERVVSGIHKAIEEKQPYWSDEYCFLRADGRDADVLDRGYLVFDPSGVPVRMVGGMMDITSRKLAEKSLHASEEKFSLVFHSSPDPMTISTLQDGIYQDVNVAFEHLVGRKREAIIGRRATEIGFFRDKEHRETFIRKVRETNVTQTTELQIRNPSGQVRMVHVSADKIEIKGIQYLLAISRDVTDQRRAEDALRDSEQRYRAVTDNATDVILSIDEEGTVLFVNHAVERIFGYTPDELMGQKVAMLMPTALKPLHQHSVSQSQELGENKQQWSGVEIVGQHKLGYKIPLEISYGELVEEGRSHFTAVIRDITERKHAAEILQVSQARYRSLLDDAPYGIYFITPEGTLLDCNRAYALMLGYANLEEIIGTNISAKIWKYPEARVVLLRTLTEKFEGIEAEWLRVDGKSLHVRLTGRRVHDGLETRYEVIAEDVTERLLLERQFHQAQKMESIGQLAAGVAHDFNNLLGVITGYSDLVMEQAVGQEKLRRRVREIKGAAIRAAGLTRQLLAFSRKQILEPKTLDLNVVVEEIGEMLRRILGAEVELVVNLEKGLKMIKADPTQIEQVVINLVVNARDALPDGGIVVIETTNVTLDQAYCQRNSADISPGNYALLSLTDTGIGMSDEVKARVFEPFFTTKEVGKGTGLGLATVYGIVKQSGGHIEIHSEINHGTTFKIYLPQTTKAVEEEVPVETVVTPRGTETILMVEDNDWLRSLHRELLQSLGYTVLEAADGSSALQIAENHTGPIHLVLTDLIMPGMSGRSVAENLKTFLPNLKVLYVSGYAEDALVHGDVLRHDATFLQKPFTRDLLATRIRTALQGSDNSNSMSKGSNG